MFQNGQTISGTLTSGTAVAVDLSRKAGPTTIWVRPTNSDTVSVEYTVDGTNWVAWPNGTVSAYSVDVLDAPVLQVRFTRASGSGTTSAYGLL